MSDASGHQRIEILESNEGEMKVQLSHIRAQIEQMMSMTQQLFQAKAADGSQQEEESGGTGRKEEKNDSGGTGRALHEEETAGARVGTTTVTAAGERGPNHSRRASNGSRPADDTGRKPEVLAGVGPTFNMGRDKTRESFLAGIAAHDGGGDLSSGFQRQPRVVSPVLKGEK